MTLIFGRLVQDFISFQQSFAALQQDPTPEAQAAFQVTAAHFRSTAATDASYLVYIGESEQFARGDNQSVA